MAYKEKDFQVDFGKWIRKDENKPKKHTNYELKLEKGLTFNFKAWIKSEPHQITNLLKSTLSEGVFHKISDQSLGKKPFDCFYSIKSDSYLVIYFLRKKKFFMLKINDVINLIKKSNSIKFDILSEKFETYELNKKGAKSFVEKDFII